MLFQPEHIIKIILDQKTQTRRAYKNDPYIRAGGRASGDICRVGLDTARFEVGRVESVMPGRGRFQVCHTAASGEERWCELSEALQDIMAQPLVLAKSMIRRDRDDAILRVRQAGYKLLNIETLAIRLDEDVVGISDADAVAEGVSPDSDDPGAVYLHIYFRINKPAIVRRLEKMPESDWREYLRNEVPVADRQCWKVDFKRVADAA